ncbi:MFS transporter [Burkholderia sp. Bp9140]|nr:MFS transporter [Burkholderia sp. Bp9140]
MNVPQAAGPVAFSLLAVSLTGKASGGAAMILAMTVAQVAGVVPLTRLGTRFPAGWFLRGLVAVRSLALASIAIGAWVRVSLDGLILLAALAGLVNGAAHGYIRVVLNQLVSAAKLPRTLGIAATLNELTFVSAPVVASGLGIVSPVLSVMAIAALGTIPALLIPDTGLSHGRSPDVVVDKILDFPVALWLMCAAAGASAVAGIEIGAVALALKFNREPALAIFFTVPLCLASITGGIWVSVRNRMSTKREVLAQLSIMATGSFLAALGMSLWVTVLGAVLIGSMVAPLGTHYSLALDALAPPHKRAEVFALLRTANAVGVIVASAVLTVVSLSMALMAVTGLMMIALVGVGVAPDRGRLDASRGRDARSS